MHTVTMCLRYATGFTKALLTTPRTRHSHATRLTLRVTSVRTDSDDWSMQCRYANIRASKGVGYLQREMSETELELEAEALL